MQFPGNGNTNRCQSASSTKQCREETTHSLTIMHHVCSLCVLVCLCAVEHKTFTMDFMLLDVVLTGTG